MTEHRNPVKVALAVVCAVLGVETRARADFLVSVSNNAGTVNRVDRFTNAGGYVGPFVTEGSGGLITPEGLAYGRDGNLYVAGFTTGAVLKYNGQTGASLGTFATDPQMTNSVLGLRFGPNGNLYVSDYNGTTSAVQEFNGVTGAKINTFNVAPGSGGLSGPVDINFTPGGDLLVSSSNTNEVLRYNATTGAFIGKFVLAGSLGLNFPDGQLITSNNFFLLSSSFSNNILRFDINGNPINSFALPAGSVPVGLLEQPSGNILVAANATHSILALNPINGAVLGTFNVPLSGSGAQGFPTYLANFQAIPEPSSFVLAGLGALGLFGAAWRRRAVAA